MADGDLSPVKPVVWMRALRDGADLTGGVLNVLLMLALRMTKDGTGFASQRQLAEDARVSQSTVRRALKDARDRGYVVRTRRGHRLNDETSVASEYRLTIPSQPVIDDTLDGCQPVTGARLAAPDDPSQPVISDPNRSSDPSQPVTRDRPRGLPPEVLLSSVPDQGSGPPSDDHEHKPTDTEIVELAAALHAEQAGIDPEDVAARWDLWESADLAKKAVARGWARTRLQSPTGVRDAS